MQNWQLLEQDRDATPVLSMGEVRAPKLCKVRVAQFVVMRKDGRRGRRLGGGHWSGLLS
jgi:hypothetical protein